MTNEKLYIRLPGSLKEKLREEAVKQHYSLNNFSVVILEKEMDKKTRTKQKEKKDGEVFLSNGS